MFASLDTHMERMSQMMKFMFDGTSFQEVSPAYLDLTPPVTDVAFLNYAVPGEMAGSGSELHSLPLIAELLLISIAIFGAYQAIKWFISHCQQKRSLN